MEYDKWVPGEGMILTEENPYTIIKEVGQLSDYVGAYKFINNSMLELKIDEREQSLVAQIGDRSYPVFYEGKDRFRDVQDNLVIFHRNEKGEVTAFSIEGESEELFSKE